MKMHSSYFQQNKLFTIAGPCSAETEIQLYKTIKSILDYSPQINLIRAGIWKPRTRPNSFEGVGQIGLPWLQSIKKEFNKPVCVEVANAQHVELALKHDIDVLWIGARSTVSPFIVQEIADAIKGVDIPIMIKNPVNPDLSLWLGAIERIEGAGIKDIAAIHRGFSSYHQSNYRNVPNWEIPIELKRLRPDISLICDPSHITGKRDKVKDVAQQAMNLQFDGLMIETHYQPDLAWSDAAQQITPESLGQLLKQLQVDQKNVDTTDKSFPTLERYRKDIDRIDQYILELLSERMNISEEIGKFKRLNDIAIYQPERWQNTIQKALKTGETNGLSEEFLLALYQKIHQESIQRQSLKEKD